jgi:hypothetical protein
MAQTPHEAQVGHRNVREFYPNPTRFRSCVASAETAIRRSERVILLTAATLHEISVTAEALTLVDRSEAACDQSQR